MRSSETVLTLYFVVSVNFRPRSSCHAMTLYPSHRRSPRRASGAARRRREGGLRIGANFAAIDLIAACRNTGTGSRIGQHQFGDVILHRHSADLARYGDADDETRYPVAETGCPCAEIAADALTVPIRLAVNADVALTLPRKPPHRCPAILLMTASVAAGDARPAPMACANHAAQPVGSCDADCSCRSGRGAQRC